MQPCGRAEGKRFEEESHSNPRLLHTAPVSLFNSHTLFVTRVEPNYSDFGFLHAERNGGKWPVYSPDNAAVGHHQMQVVLQLTLGSCGRGRGHLIELYLQAEWRILNGRNGAAGHWTDETILITRITVYKHVDFQTYILKGAHLESLQDLLSVLLKDVQVGWSFSGMSVRMRMMVVVLLVVMPKPPAILAHLGAFLMRRPHGRRLQARLIFHRLAPAVSTLILLQNGI